MQINVQFFSQLRDIAGIPTVVLETPEGTSVESLLTMLYGRYPRLGEWNDTILIGAGVEFVGRDHVLQPNENIAIMPPVQGG